MASTISRATWTNDSGTAENPNGDGTIINNTRLQEDVYDKVDTLVATSPLVLNSLTLDAQPRCLAYHSTTQTLTTGVAAALSLDSETYDVGAMHSTVTNDSRVTVPTGQGGVYFLRGQVTFAADADGLRAAYFKKNDTTYLDLVQVPTAGAGNPTGIQVCTVQVLTAGDFIELYAVHTAGNDLAVGSATRSQANELILVKLC